MNDSVRSGIRDCREELRSFLCPHYLKLSVVRAMDDLTQLSIAEILEGLSRKDFTSVEITEQHLMSIERLASLNTYVTVTRDLALEMARASDMRRAKGEVGLLEGVPMGIKDLLCTKDVRTTACSKVLENFISPYESTVSGNLWKDGAVMLGKLSCDEFAMGSSNETSYFGPVINPWKSKDERIAKKDLVPGGSSGGSAAAVAARLCAGAIGTDSGGSIRQPSAFCGVVGMKPTYGRCSRWGVIAFTSSLDQAGPITRSVRDSAIMLKSIASVDYKDSTSADVEVSDYEKLIGESIKGKVVGIPKEYKVDGMTPEVEKLWSQGAEWLKEAGASVREISLPHTEYALPAYCILSSVEVSSNLSCYDGMRYGLRVNGKHADDIYSRTRSSCFGSEVRRRVLLGAYLASNEGYEHYCIQAQKIRTLVKRDFETVFRTGVDVILTPAAPSEAFVMGEKSNNPASMHACDILTVATNLAGLPAIAIPAGTSLDGLPLSLQLIGPAFCEDRLFQIGTVIEERAGKFPAPGLL